MSTESQTESAEAVPQNPAVERCQHAWQQAFDKSISQFGTVRAKAVSDAGEAYRRVMPTLDSELNIRNFVACVGHGLLTGVFTSTEAPRLLYAAQIAISATRNAKSAQKLAA